MFIVLQLSLAQHNYRKQLRYMLQLFLCVPIYYFEVFVIQCLAQKYKQTAY